MLKKELKNLYARVGDGEQREVALPFVLSACTGRDEIVPSPEEEKRAMMRSLSLSVTVTLPEQMRGFRGRALCLHGLLGHCIVSLDGVRVEEWRSPPKTVFLPLQDAERPVLLELSFPERTVPMDVGILGGIELVAFSHDLITDVYTEQLHKNEKCELYVRVRTLCGIGDAEAIATLYSPSGEIHYLGLVRGEGRIVFSSVQRYRPAGKGIAGLYRLVVTLYHDGQPSDSFETHIGFRKLTFSKDGASVPFEVMLDDAPCFIKAARICAHPALSAEKNAYCFERALPAFMKMGGNALFATCESGLLPDRVYALCDRLGLLVFQQLPSLQPDMELNDYFAELKASLSPLLDHPSLALLILPEGVSSASELGRAIKGFFAFSFPCVSVCGAPALGFPDIARIASMPSPLAVRRYLPMEARRIFSYAMESAQDSPTQLISMLNAAAEELPYGASLEDVSYVTAICSAEAAQNELALALERGVPGGLLGGTLFEGGISMKPSLMDGILERKALYFDLQRTFAPLFLHVRAQGCEATVTLASSKNEAIGVRVITCLMDNSNNRIARMSDDCVVPAGAPLILKKHFADAARHEREYYVLVSVYANDALLCEKTALFVPAKHFRFVYPGVQCEIKGSGRSYEIALSASAYVRRLRLSFAKTAARFEKNFFDIVSDTKILLSVETEEVTTSRHLEAQLRMRSLYDVGRITERELADEMDFDA